MYTQISCNTVQWKQNQETWVQGGRKLGGKGGKRGRLFDTACALQVF